MTTLKLDALNQGSGSIKNRGGFARIADNSINACVWSNDNHLVHNNNNFSYVPGMTFTNSPIPCSNEVTLTNSTNVLLPPTHTKSANANHSMIQYVDVNTSFKINTTSNAVSPVFIVRTNPNTNTLASPLISNENYFYDQEIFTSAATYTFGGYNKPGLYGIDVLAFDVQDLNSGTPEEYNFRSSAWNHIPVIVKGATEQTLYFNIKDSYEQDAGPTGVRKQAYLNDLLIWEEDISQGGTGWEYIEVDLRGLAVDQVTEIFSALKTDGTPNILSFSISIAASVSSVDVAGLYVWIDDIYIPVTGSANGDNLIKDGTVELTNSACSTCDWFINTSGNANVTGCGSTSAGVHEKEKKSGNRAIYLNVPNNNNCTFTTTDRIVASVGTNIDFTGILNCGDYTSSPFNYTEMDYIISTPVTKSGAYFMANDIVIQQGGKLTLSSCSLVVMPHSPPYRILIESGGELTLISTATNATRIYSCEDMWGGIVSTNGTILSTSTHKSKVEDAITAFDCEGGNIQIRNIEFKNCWQSFNLHATPTNQFTSSSFVRGCKFYLSDHVLTKSPHEDEIPFVHMELNNISNFSFPIGNNVAGLKNEFHNATNGIIVRNSLFTLYNNYFYSIHSVVPVNSGTRNYGRGVSIFNTTLAGGTTLLGGSGTNEGNFFENVNLGIQIYNSCPTCNYTITNNRLDNTNYGEKGIGTSFYNTAITVQGPFSISGPIVEIFDNTILNNRIGIHTININNLIIGTPDPVLTTSNPAKGNTITYNTMVANSENRAIWVQNSANAQINDNVISNTDQNTIASYAAIEMSDAINGRVRRNTLSGIGINSGFGMLFRNACDLTYLECNSISDFNKGIRLVDAELTEQGLPPSTPTGTDGEGWKNEWNANIAFTDRVVGNTISNNPIPWYHNGDELSIFSPSENLSFVVRPFKNQIPMADCDNPTYRGFDRDLVYGPILGDTAYYYSNEAANNYLAKKKTYEILKSDTSLLTTGRNTDSTFYDFFFEMQNSNLEFLTLPENLTELSLDSLYASNVAINDTNDIEANQKVVNAIYLNSLIENADFSPTDTVTLTDISWQQTAVAGKAVYFSRALLFLEVHENIPELRMMPTVTQSNLASNTSSRFQQLKLFPNPTSQSLFIEKDPQLILKRIEFQNTMGETIFISTSDINLLQIEWLNSGIYLLKAYDAAGKIWYSSFTKID